MVYSTALVKDARLNADNPGLIFGLDVFERMAPRDPAEELLIGQMLATHARVMHLSSLANKQTGLDQIRTINEYADRASNTYRRLMLALAEYRRPPRAGDTISVVQQTHVTGPPVAPTHGREKDNATNEQGCDRLRGGVVPADSRPALPADGEGLGFPSLVGEDGEAVGTLNRPANPRWKDSLAHECDQAR